MAITIVSNCLCHDCKQPMDVQPQADGRGGYYLLVTCWNRNCLLFSVTRSLVSYSNLTECDFESYRQMNRARMAVQHA